MTVSRPILRWHGGKWRLAPWIIEQMPRHDAYIEPYGGGASVLLRKSRAQLEVYNDLDGAVVNLFQVLRHQPDALAAAVALTPFSRSEFALHVRLLRWRTELTSDCGQIREQIRTTLTRRAVLLSWC